MLYRDIDKTNEEVEVGFRNGGERSAYSSAPYSERMGMRLDCVCFAPPWGLEVNYTMAEMET